MAFPQFAELWKLIDLLVRKDFRQANLGPVNGGAATVVGAFEDAIGHEGLLLMPSFNIFFMKNIFCFS
jgi:aminoglycoside N3'-acetyltransferase